MAAQKTAAKPQSQSDKFIEAAREHGCDEDEARWNEKLKKVVRQRPIPDQKR
ncbi:MAG: hypothetical protein ACT4N8_10155 [Sphingosinicella sp.]|uniref:hypothetical protein n=1 Tax=Sphingosinicella sp. TaxID=1917971 RepID=UPI0040384661